MKSEFWDIQHGNTANKRSAQWTNAMWPAAGWGLDCSLSELLPGSSSVSAHNHQRKRLIHTRLLDRRQRTRRWICHLKFRSRLFLTGNTTTMCEGLRDSEQTRIRADFNFICITSNSQVTVTSWTKEIFHDCIHSHYSAWTTRAEKSITVTTFYLLWCRLEPISSVLLLYS